MSPRQDATVRFANGLLAREDGSLEPGDLYINASTGKIISGQNLFFTTRQAPTSVIDLQGTIIAPGFIDVQINGAYGVDFSHYDGSDGNYVKALNTVASKIVETGTTSLVPTIITQQAELYAKLLPLLGPRSSPGSAHILGYHAEGPFLFPDKKGIHGQTLLLKASAGVKSWESLYSAKALDQPGVKIITAAPDVEGVLDTIKDVSDRGVTFSIGHSNANIQLASEAVKRGARLVTHLFNAMPQLHHRDPGVIGLLGAASPTARPYYGIIADGIHVHSNVVRLAYDAHPDGCILVTDAMFMMDPNLPDGAHQWRDGRVIVKKGLKLFLEGTETIAGSTVSMDGCVRNHAKFTASSLGESIRAATYNPAQMLGGDIAKNKGHLRAGGDADLVILDHDGKVISTWVAGKCVFSR